MKASKKNYSRPSGVVMTLADPSAQKSAFDGQVGGTFQWRSETHDYSNFEICFRGRNPFDDALDRRFTGDDLSPVVIRLQTVGDYEYDIVQKGGGGDTVNSGPHPFSVHPCKGCPPE